jgi:hypothetical protein
MPKNSWSNQGLKRSSSSRQGNDGGIGATEQESWNDFSSDDFEELLNQAPKIERMPFSQFWKSFENLAEYDPEHTAERWRAFYEHKIRPAYIQQMAKTRQESSLKVPKGSGSNRANSRVDVNTTLTRNDQSIRQPSQSSVKEKPVTMSNPGESGEHRSSATIKRQHLQPENDSAEDSRPTKRIASSGSPRNGKIAVVEIFPRRESVDESEGRAGDEGDKALNGKHTVFKAIQQDYVASPNNITASADDDLPLQDRRKARAIVAGPLRSPIPKGPTKDSLFVNEDEGDSEGGSDELEEDPRSNVRAVEDVVYPNLKVADNKHAHEDEDDAEEDAPGDREDGIHVEYERAEAIGIESADNEDGDAASARSSQDGDTQAYFDAETQLPDLTLAQPGGGVQDEISRPRKLYSREGSVGTQAIFNSDTQMPDLTLPPISEAYDGANPPSSPPIPSSNAAGDDLDEDDEGLMIALNAWVDSQCAAGRTLDLVGSALYHASNDPVLAEIAIEALEQRGEVPTDVKGLWTEQDDEAVEGGNARLIRKMESKHGWNAVQDRFVFLRDWREGMAKAIAGEAG